MTLDLGVGRGMTLKRQLTHSDAHWASLFSCGVRMGDPKVLTGSDALCFHDPRGQETMYLSSLSRASRSVLMGHGIRITSGDWLWRGKGEGRRDSCAASKGVSKG